MNELMGVLRADGEGRGAVRFERDYATDPADLWSALTEPERVGRWLDKVTGDLRPGGAAVVHFDDGDAAFEIDTCEPPTLLVVRWRHESSSSEVRAEVSPGPGGGSRLVLDHSRLTNMQAPGYGAGWHLHLRALDALLRGEEPAAWDTFDALHTDYRAAAAGLRKPAGEQVTESGLARPIAL